MEYASDKNGVEQLCWTFARGGDRLMLRREETGNGVNLTVAGEGVPRVYAFDDIARLVRFQSDMEAFLLRTGWHFVEFTPERRSGIDRRDFPRIASDRRRWWTDGIRLFLHRRPTASRAVAQPGSPGVPDVIVPPVDR